MSNDLPQVCCRCRKLKLAHLGQFSFVRHRHNTKVWTCDECRGKQPTAVPRLGRAQHPPSPHEREVAAVLAELRVDAKQEYQLPGQRLFYDFALPSLRLLLEVDPVTYHRHASRRHRDQVKDRQALEAGWKLVRLVPPHVGTKARIEVERRLAELG